MAVTLNASTSSGLVQTADTSGQIELQSNGTTKATVSSSGLAIGQYNPSTSLITSGTAVASTSGTSIDFTSIPSWVKRITIMLNGVSTNGSSVIQFQIGTSGGVQSTGYAGAGGLIFAGFSAYASNFTTGFGTTQTGQGGASMLLSGSATLSLLDSSNGTWVANGLLAREDATAIQFTGGKKVLSGTLDRVRITTVNGTDTFDAGSINILYE